MLLTMSRPVPDIQNMGTGAPKGVAVSALILAMVLEFIDRADGGVISLEARERDVGYDG